MDPTSIFLTANILARKHGIDRIDIVRSRSIGLKPRGYYVTLRFTLLRFAHIDLEGPTLDREIRALRDSFVTANYAKIMYNGPLV